MKTEGRNAVIELLKTDKNIDKIGDMYINAIVGICGNSNFSQLKNARKEDVMNMSKQVYKAIFDSVCLK